MAADPLAILRRLERAKTARSNVETDIRDCYRMTDPARGAGFETLGSVVLDKGASNFSTSADKKAELLTDVGTDSARILASSLMSGGTPANMLWAELDVPDASDSDRKWLEKASKTQWQNIHNSNYDAVGFDAMYDIVIAGQTALFVDEAPEGGYRFEQWILANTYFSASRSGGPVDTVFNEIALTAEQAVNEYGENMVSENVLKAYRENPDQQFTFVRAVYPRAGKHGNLSRNLPIASCHVEKDTKKLVRESGYHEMPVGVPRWKIMPGSDYALGPVYDSLPTLRSLNKAWEMLFMNMDLATAGMWIAEDDGILNPRTVRVGARKIIVANSVDSMKALTPAAKFDAAFLNIERMEANVRKMLMADNLSPQHDDPVRTATDVTIRTELIRQLLGPVYGRMFTEYIRWLTLRCFGIAYRAGVYGPAPESLQDKVLSVRATSPLARAQRSVEVAAMDRYEASVAQAAAATGNMDLLDNYDWDKGTRLRQDLLGVPKDLKVEQDVIDAKREARAQAQQQQQQHAQAMEMAEAVGQPAA
jgi:hypothetical protein